MVQKNSIDNNLDTQELTGNLGFTGDPAGVAAAGGTPDQAKMAGTPAQVQANIQMQEMAQKQRLKEQEKEAQEEQARLGEQTLVQQQEYRQPSPTEDQERAANIANTMRVLGPVQARVQGLIQSRLTLAQRKQVTTSVDEASIQKFMADNGVDVKNVVVTDQLNALKTAIADNDQDAYQKAYQALYDVIAPDAFSGTAEGIELQEKFANFIQGSFGTAEASISETVSPVISAGGATIGSLNLGAIDITNETKGDIAKALGFLDANGNADVAQLDNLTLDELNAAIDNMEAQELGRIEQLRSMLQDPTLSNSMRQAIYDELRQLGAAGAIGAQADLEKLQAQIDEANTITLFGEEYTLEQALSDDGISDLIAKAAKNKDLLDSMLKDPNYQSLAQWIIDNKASVDSLLTDYKLKAEDFVAVQKKYKDFTKVLGEGGDKVVLEIAKAFSPGMLTKDAEGNFKFKNSLTTTEFTMFTEEVKKSNIFKTIFDDKNNKLKAEYTEFFNDIKDTEKNPGLLQQFLQTKVVNGKPVPLYSSQDIKNTVELKKAFDSENSYFKLLYGGLDGYVSSDDYFGKEGGKGLSKIAEGEEEGQLEILTKWKKLDTDTKEQAVSVQDTVAKSNMITSDKKSYEKIPFLSVDELVKINETGSPKEVASDLQNWVKEVYGVKGDLKQPGYRRKFFQNGKLNAKVLKSSLFGNENFDWKDLSQYYKNASKETKDVLLDILDGNNDDKISQEEYNTIDGGTYERLMEYMGLGAFDDKGKFMSDADFKNKLIKAKGAVEFKDKLPLNGIGATEYETAKQGEALDIYNTKWGEYDNQRKNAASKYGYTSVDDGSNVVTEFNNTLENVNSTIKENKNYLESNLRDIFQGYKIRTNDNWINQVFQYIEQVDYSKATDIRLGEEHLAPKTAKPGYEQFYKLMTEGSGASKIVYDSGRSAADILNDVVQNGVPPLSWENGKIDTQNYDEYVKALKYAESYFATLESGLTMVIDRHINDRPRVEGVERVREGIIRDKVRFGMLRSQAESAPGGQVDNYNKFYDEYSTAEKNIQEYDNWFTAFKEASSKANGKATLNGKAYTFDQLLDQGAEKGWVTA